MAKLLYVLTESTRDPDRSATGLAAAAAAAEASHDVALWLQGEGVRLAVRGVSDALLEPGVRRASESLDVLATKGAALHVSAPCFAKRGFEADLLRDGATLAEPAALAALVADGWVPVPAD